MKPIIGLIAEVDDEKKNGMKHPYSVAIEAAGGIPLLIPYSENEETQNDYVTRLDGFVFTGGADMDPKLFGEEKKITCGRIYPLRDAFERQMLQKILAARKPILAICRGMQVINVAFGGTLYQDIPTEYETTLCHAQSVPSTEPSHDIFIKEKTPLAALLGKTRMMGNSFHHQAIKALGKGLCITATAEDGIIEAISYEGNSYLRGYQWHPERLCGFDRDNLRLFEEFIGECRK